MVHGLALLRPRESISRVIGLFPLRWFAAAALCAATVAHAVTRERIDALFRPFLAELVSLSPDGRHLAYTEHVGDKLHVVIMKLEEPFSKVRLVVDK